MTLTETWEDVYARRFDGLTDDEIKLCITEQFKKDFGFEPNYDNPKTFNEKLAWEKLYYRNPLLTICADKVKARDYFCEKIKDGKKHLVKQYGVYKSPDEIDFDALPNSFILKSNWGSGQQIIVKDKSTLNIEDAKKKMSYWMDRKTNHYFLAFEVGYKDIEPRIVCEEILDFEYKLEFFCFNGNPRFFWIVKNDKTADVHANFYNIDWIQIPLRYKYPNFTEKAEKPADYQEMLDVAKILCAPFPHVRCDFYASKTGYRFSEMTFYTWAGQKQFTPNEYDRVIGDMLTLPINK